MPRTPYAAESVPMQPAGRAPVSRARAACRPCPPFPPQPVTLCAMRSLLVVLVATAAVPAQVAFARLPQLPATQGMALALDPLRGRVVAYSGETAATYEWDGHRWEEMATASAP